MRTPLTHTQFFQLCEALRNERERLTTEQPSLKVALEALGKKLGFAINEHCIVNAMEATGIQWPLRRKAKSEDKEVLQTITFNLILVMNEIGVQASQSLLDLYERLTGRKFEVCSGKSITNEKKLSIANGVKP